MIFQSLGLYAEFIDRYVISVELECESSVLCKNLESYFSQSAVEK
jgi:hypothetical protein